VQRILAELAPDAALLVAYSAEQLVREMTGEGLKRTSKGSISMQLVHAVDLMTRVVS
jgi:hypothetical protein